jgi:hypothetical protein
MIDRDTAVQLAADHGERHLPDLGPRSWRPTRFDGGWLLTADGDDLRWRTGVACLVIQDDGTIHEESSSLPPDLLFERYGTGPAPGPTDPADPSGASTGEDPEPR